MAVDELGPKIRELRVASDLSISELANRSGIAKSYLSYIERGLRTNPSIEVLEKLCTALHVDIRAVIQSSAEATQTDINWLSLLYQVQSLGLSEEEIRTMLQQLRSQNSQVGD